MINTILNIITTKKSNPYYNIKNNYNFATYLYNRLLKFKLINKFSQKFNIDLLLYHLFNIEEYIKINNINIEDISELNKIINLSSNNKNSIIILRTEFYLINKIHENRIFTIIKYIISKKPQCPFYNINYTDEYIEMIIYFLKYFDLINENTKTNDLEIILYHLNNVIDILIDNNIDIKIFKTKIINCIREYNNIILNVNFNDCILDIKNIRRSLFFNL
jgi:hypothetical protein